jgi:hypothetical protein
MDRQAPIGLHRAALIDRLADDIEDPPQRLGTHRHHNRPAGIDDLGAAHQPVGGVHRNRADDVFAELLRHFEDQGPALLINVQRGQDLRQLAVEADVDDRADDLGDRADTISGHVSKIPVWTLTAPRRRR